MVKVHKVFLIAGCVTSLLSGVISVVQNKFDTYAFISALLFFNLYLSLITNTKLENAINDHVKSVRKIIKK